jgi:DNA-directed RNA polymerase III subunit RPC4
MTASGPFALGPALATSQARHSVLRADFTPAVPTSATTSAALGEKLARATAPGTLRGSDKGKAKVKEEEEVYSDADEGVEIIDMKKIKDMDWMAPDTLLEEKRDEKMKKERESDAIGM